MAPSIPSCRAIAFAQDGLDEAAQAANRTVAPVGGEGGVLGTGEGGDPAGIEPALAGEVGEHRRQQGVEVICRGLREDNDKAQHFAEPVDKARLAAGIADQQ